MQAMTKLVSFSHLALQPHQSVWQAFCVESKLVFKMIYLLEYLQVCSLQTIRLDTGLIRRLGMLEAPAPRQAPC